MWESRPRGGGEKVAFDWQSSSEHSLPEIARGMADVHQFHLHHPEDLQKPITQYTIIMYFTVMQDTVHKNSLTETKSIAVYWFKNNIVQQSLNDMILGNAGLIPSIAFCNGAVWIFHSKSKQEGLKYEKET